MFERRYLPTRSSRSLGGLLMVLLLCIYAVENLPIMSRLDGIVFSFLIRPALWLSVAFLIYKLPTPNSHAILRRRESLKLWAFNFAVIFVVISIGAGVFDGMGKSPYSHTPTGILMNIFLVGSMLLGRELARSWIVNNCVKGESYIFFVFLALLMTLISFPVSRFLDIKDYEGLVKFLAQYFAADFSHNLFAVYLAYLGGPIPPLIYMGVIQAFNWLSPILPDLQWLTAALIGIMCPVFFLTAMQNIYAKEAKLLKKRDESQESVLSWIVTSILSIVIIWFSVGVFPVYPSVIATGSMEPMIMPGDVILVKKIKDISEVHVGDVIQFRRDSILISHRVMEIKEDKKKGTSYKTKGDNNSGPDTELVQPEDIKGEIIKVIPKVGWPTLLIKSGNEKPDDVEF